MAGSDPAIRALLPVRVFFGATFLYAGFDKLLDPRFLDPSSAASIQAQLAAFARVSPLAPLVRFGQPWAGPIGVAIALLEIAIGLGALTGLAYRAAAWAGAGLSLLFFLTASWTTRPFYYGPDLPYAAGWISLAVAGHGGILVAHRLIGWASGHGPLTAESAGASHGPGSPRTDQRSGRRAARSMGRLSRPTGRPPRPTTDLPLRDRRTVLQAGALGLLTLIAASIAIPFRSETAAQSTDGGGPADGDAETGGGSTGPRDARSPGPLSSPGVASAPSIAPGSSIVVARIADLAKTGARAFTVPFTAPAPLPAGDPGVIVQLGDGTYVAFDAVCTHAGCTVQWDQRDRVLVCPCHGAAFDPARSAAVLQGPTNQPLTALPISVDSATGTITLRT